MEQKRCGVGGVYIKFKPHLLMISVQLVYSILYFITEASFIHGLNPYIYVTYRNILAGLVLLPFAYFLERKIRPKLTMALFLEIFVLSLLGMSLSLNMYFASLKYTNPTFATVLYNTLSSITFIIAVILRVEVVNLRNPRSIAKVVGTLVSLGGVMVVTLYRGPIIRDVWPPLIHIHKNDHIHEEWFKGSLLAIASCISWALWYIMQAYSLKRYPAELSLTTWMCLVGGAQSAVFTVIVEPNLSAWTIGFDIDLLSIAYSGIVASGLFIFVQLWCTKEKGPVFVTMFNPLLTVLVAVLSYFVVGDKLHLGCIVGAIVVVIGLYLLIWGKEEEQEGDINSTKQRFNCTSNDPQKQEGVVLMEQKRCGLGGVRCKFKPHLLMILVQLGYSFLYFIAEASFNHGLNPYVYVTYRNILAGLVLLPFAYFLERKIRPKLTMALFLEIFVLSLLGLSLSLNMYFAGLKYTSPTFVTALYNTIASITFVIAVILRVEVINLRNPRSIAKVVGTVVSFGGVMIVTLYRGPIIRNVWPPLIHIHKHDHIHQEWFKGSFLVIASCMAWAIWYIMQAYTLKRYPAQLSLTTWMCLVGGAQSAMFTVIVERSKSAWTIGFNIDLWSIIYGGVVASGLLVFIQLWCTEEKGPVFVTMFNPLLTVLVAVLSYFVVGDRLHLGCIVGAIVVVIGLYLLIWGKEEEQEGGIDSTKEPIKCTSDDTQKTQKKNATGTDELP
ncbi:uncharacterized protein LOC129308397 [Prosopis cineraria]|uniref:uncharacterized protein LOC129308397 n=1 Tax=Prosopis cineraria TaxID=364024 RepID=UPI00240FC86C|nr:uncharacterized protein LOC129308397 [Prosopis cineraria]